MKYSILLAVGVAIPACTLLVDTSDLRNGSEGALADGGMPSDSPSATRDAPSGDPDGQTNPDASLTVADRYRAIVMVDKPFSYWRFEDGPDATTAKDEMGRVDGTYEGASPSVAGAMVGSTGVMLGEGKVVNLGDHFDLAGDAPYTIEVWLKSAGQGFFMQKLARTAGGLPSQGWLFAVQLPTARLTFECWWDDTARRGTEAFETDVTTRFVHVAVTFSSESGGPKIYIDGVHTENPQGTYQTANAKTDLAVPLVFGSMPGVIDEAAFYDRAIGADRIQAHVKTALGKKD